MAYICLSVFFNLRYYRKERTRDKRTGHRYIFYRSLSDLHFLSSYQFFSHSVILLLLFSFFLDTSSQHVFPPPAFSLASGRELAYIVLTAHGLVGRYLPAIKLSIKLSMYLAGNVKYYKLKQGTRSEKLISTMRCLFIIIIIIIRAFWVIDGKERKRGRERGLQISSRRFLYSRDYRMLVASLPLSLSLKKKKKTKNEKEKRKKKKTKNLPKSTINISYLLRSLLSQSHAYTYT